MFLNFRLNKKDRFFRIKACPEPIEEHLTAVVTNFSGLVKSGCQDVPIGNHKVTGVFILQFVPVLKSAGVISPMQTTCGSHAAENNFFAFIFAQNRPFGLVISDNWWKGFTNRANLPSVERDVKGHGDLSKSDTWYYRALG